jgi:hypothetical protein
LLFFTYLLLSLIFHIIISYNLNYSNGLLIYNYKRQLKIFKYFNIGDYIQSLAAEQFINKKGNIIYLDRDDLNYTGSKIKIIFNCWYYIYTPIKFPENLIPLFISFHISNTDKIKYMKKILKKYEPIGARDYNTMIALQKNGIKSYFSSCLTLTLGITYSSKIKKNIIYLVDYKFKKNILIDLEIINILKFYQPDEVKFINHLVNMKTSHKKRFEIAKNYLKKYIKLN